MIQIDKTDLDFKRTLLLEEAHKLKTLSDLMAINNDPLIRVISGMPGHVQGNWGISFIQTCVNNVDTIGAKLMPDKYIKSEFKWTDDMLSLWQQMDGRCKKGRPVAGDLVVMHYVKHNRLIMSGQLGIITKVNPDLTVHTLEASLISQFENEPLSSQVPGIHDRLRTSKGTARMRVLGYFSPWTDR